MRLPKGGLPTLIAALGPIGYLPVAPGTWGSGAGALIWWVGPSRLEWWWSGGVLLLFAGLSVYVAGRAERHLGHDARPIVIDEVAGQWLTLMFAPRIWWAILAGFFFFRIFDIVKPFPAGRSQRLPGGWGIVVDDLIAGLYAALALQLMIRLIGLNIAH
ncbi:MAG: phosphatidylglycerophosphatase A [Calditrichaeota bacterium]|nr:phosphatidylglycerophosphatase A [Calditrichota bacterium]